jgi:hypothetical protein
MPKWVSIFDDTPTVNKLYFVKINGAKALLRLDEFNRSLNVCETFYWLDESDEEQKFIRTLTNVKTVDEFSQLDYKKVSEHLLTPYNPRIHKSIVLSSFHKYYLRIIADLRKKVSTSGERLPKIEITNVPAKKKNNALGGDQICTYKI